METISSMGEAGPQYLLANDLTQAVQPRGEVVAFVGSGAVVTLADSADPAAVEEAARVSADRLAATGLVACLQVQPLVLREGS